MEETAEQVELTIHATEEFVGVSEASESPPPSLPMRILQGFQNVEEAEFWPSEITTIVNTLMAPQTFKEFNEIINSSIANNLNNIQSDIQSYRKEYDGCLTNLDKTPNVFSFDIDYI